MHFIDRQPQKRVGFRREWTCSHSILAFFYKALGDGRCNKTIYFRRQFRRYLKREKASERRLSAPEFVFRQKHTL